MLNFKKVLKFIILADISVVGFIFNNTALGIATNSETNLRPPILSSNADVRRLNKAVDEMMGRRTFLAGVLTGGAEARALGFGNAYPAVPSFAAQNLQDIAKIFRDHGYPDDRIDHILTVFNKGLKEIVDKYQKIYSSIKGLKGKDYEERLLEMLRDLRRDVKDRGYFRPLNPFLELLVRSLDSKEDIFQIIEEAKNTGKTRQELEELRRELTFCSAKNQLASILLNAIGVTNAKAIMNVNAATSLDHSFIMIELGNNRYLLADFTLDKFKIVELSDSDDSHYYRRGGYWFLKEKYKIIPARLRLLRQQFKNEELSLLPSLKEEEIENLFYSFIHIVPKIDVGGNEIANPKGATVSIYLKRVWTYLELGLFGKAEEECRKGMEIDPNYAEMYGNLGCALSHFNRWAEALEAFKKAVELNPENAILYSNLGSAYAAFHDWENVIKAYKQVLRIDPELVTAYRNLGDAYVKLGRVYEISKRYEDARKMYEEAIESCKKGISLSPNHPSLHIALGLAYYCSVRYKDAIKELEKAQKLEPNWWEPYYLLGLIYYQERDYGKALKLFETASTLNPNVYETYLYMGWSYYKLNRHQEAIDSWAMALRLKIDIISQLPEDEEIRRQVREKAATLTSFQGQTQGLSAAERLGSVILTSTAI